MALPGIVITFVAVIGGFALAGGAFGVLIQPAEFIVIAGAGLGALITSAPGLMRKRVLHALKMALKDTIPKQAQYLELLKCQYEFFLLARRQGVLALEAHVVDPSKSDIFNKYPCMATYPEAKLFLAEALVQIVNGTTPDDLDSLLAEEIETRKFEGHLASGLLKTVGDSLPGMGIVAAVLGIIVTMGHMDAPPAEIGHHIAAALVGTFLGILLCYGLVAPIAANAECQETHHMQFLAVIKASVVATARGVAPPTAIEFGRKVIFSDERPPMADVDAAIDSLKGP